MHTNIIKRCYPTRPKMDRCYILQIQSDSVVSLDMKVHFLSATFQHSHMNERNRVKGLSHVTRNAGVSICVKQTIKTPTSLSSPQTNHTSKGYSSLWTGICLINYDPLPPTLWTKWQLKVSLLI